MTTQRRPTPVVPGIYFRSLTVRIAVSETKEWTIDAIVHNNSFGGSTIPVMSGKDGWMTTREYLDAIGRVRAMFQSLLASTLDSAPSPMFDEVTD